MEMAEWENEGKESEEEEKEETGEEFYNVFYEGKCIKVLTPFLNNFHFQFSIHDQQD